jgi:hypothetical protein
VAPSLRTILVDRVARPERVKREREGHVVGDVVNIAALPALDHHVAYVAALGDRSTVERGDLSRLPFQRHVAARDGALAPQQRQRSRLVTSRGRLDRRRQSDRNPASRFPCRLPTRWRRILPCHGSSLCGIRAANLTHPSRLRRRIRESHRPIRTRCDAALSTRRRTNRTSLGGGLSRARSGSDGAGGTHRDPNRSSSRSLFCPYIPRFAWSALDSRRSRSGG